jgi:uncharacterized protein (DUF1330 family)
MTFRLFLSLFAGAAMVAATLPALKAEQAATRVFVVNEVDITDQDGFRAYAQAQQKIIEKNGGKYVVRGGKVLATLSGTPPTGMYTVYSFDNQQKMQAWRDDPEQANLRAMRDKAAKVRTFIVEGPDR